MAQAKYKKKETKPRGEIALHLKRGIKEGLLFLLGGIAIYLLISLVTYSPRDPGWSRSVESWQVHNYGGVFGAKFADIFLSLFGYMAYLIPVFFAVAGWLIYRSHEKTLTIDRKHLLFKSIGLIFSLVGGTGLAAMHFSGALGELPYQSGGILGQNVAAALVVTFSFVGTTIFLLILFLAGIPLVVNFSWFWLMDEVGRLVLNLYDFLRDRFYSLKETHQSRVARQQRVKTVSQKQQVVQQKKPPRIAPVIKEVKVSERAQKEKQVSLFGDNPEAMPPLALLHEVQNKDAGLSKEALEALARLVELKLNDFGISVEVEAIHPGPVITRFEVQPAAGVKSSQISNLSKDLARAMSVASVRVVEVIPGKTTIGLEIPNENREIISLADILRSKEYEASSSSLTLALGKDISGQPVVADLARMPHLLVAGTTGSGKSVAINAMILSLLYKATPKDVRLIMIDPKMLELSVYEGIPHLLAPVVTDMKEAANALRWCVAEMERRYQLMAALGVRNIAGANRKLKEAREAGNPILDPLHNPELSMDPAQPLEDMPYIVVIIDELADMMMVVGKKVEELIARLAQKARAAGIHLVLATQRPSVDVITGLIKANIPTRIAFQVSSKIDSRTILDQMGAETLLGHGDMLYLPPGTAIPNRVHGAFVDDDEVHGVVDHLKKFGEADYIEDILSGPSEGGAMLPGEASTESSGESDPLYDQAVAIVTESRRASISGVQRRLKIGYNRAARLIEEMEIQGIVSPMQANGNREVLAPPPPKG